MRAFSTALEKIAKDKRKLGQACEAGPYIYHALRCGTRVLPMLFSTLGK